MEFSESLICLAFDFEENFVVLLEFFLFNSFVCKGLYNADSEKAVFDLGVYFTDLGAFAVECMFKFPAKFKNEISENRNHKEDENRKRNIHAHKDYERSNEFYNSDKNLFRCVVGKFGNVEKVFGKAAHKLADFVVAVKTEAEILKMGEKVLSHIRFKVCAHKVADVYHKIVCAGIDNAEKKINSGNFKDHLNGKGTEIVGCGVGDGSYDHRKNDIAKGRKNGAEKVKRKGRKIGFIIGHKTAEKAGFSHFLFHGENFLSENNVYP
jgi:hypothetical protein